MVALRRVVDTLVTSARSVIDPGAVQVGWSPEVLEITPNKHTKSPLVVVGDTDGATAEEPPVFVSSLPETSTVDGSNVAQTSAVRLDPLAVRVSVAPKSPDT
jgi:hypothetical protein